MKPVLPNVALLTDAYKQTHWIQYPRGTEYVFSYLESRGGLFGETVFFGLQILLKKYLEGAVIDYDEVEYADKFCKSVFGQDYFNRDGWNYICDSWGGKLPVEIKAIPEGTVVPTKNALMTVVNTDPEVPFITNFLETLLVQVWYPITVATMSYQIRKLIQSYADKAGEEVSPFHLNDFGFRGVSSVESAGIGGAAHLVNFAGTDTLEGIRYAMEYYDADICGGSVMAAEHSTVTSYGKENERVAYKTIIDKCPTGGVVSIVSDSYDIMNAVDKIYGDELKDYILSRDFKLVVRPDSGDPVDVSNKVISTIYEKFGGRVNDMGYITLNPKIGVIYGDGINYDAIKRILDCVVIENKFAPSNIIFGMGGGLLQQLNRDTQRMAFKCSAININGKWIDVYKDPVTDTTKKSKRGRMRVVKVGGKYSTIPYDNEDEPNELVTVFCNGDITKEYTFDQIRARVLE
jgi:nicotinamide phosphoribosyltransferase